MVARGARARPGVSRRPSLRTQFALHSPGRRPVSVIRPDAELAVDTPPLFVAFPDVLRLDAGAGAEVVYAPLTRSAHVLSPLRARAFWSCRGLATLDEHAAR